MEEVMNLFELFEQRVASYPNSYAIIDEKEEIKKTYSELLSDASLFANQLSSHGIGLGDRVLILEGMSYRLYVSLIALFKLGATAVFVDPSQTAEFVNHACLIAEPKAMIASPKALLLKLKFRSIWLIPLTICTKKIPFFHSMNLNFQGSNTDLSVDAQSEALMSFTSGSTALPKAIVRTHEFLLQQHQVLLPHIELQEKERDFTALPVFLLANLLSGLCSVIANVSLQSPQKIAPDKLLHTINKYKIQRIGASPALYEQLVRSKKSIEFSPRAFYMGGAPVMPSLLHKLHKKFPQTSLHVLYGSTEAEPISHYELGALTQEIEQKMLRGGGLYVGKVVPQITLKFLEDGEILVSGAHVVKSYYKQVGDKENKLIEDGVIWHKTGDIGYLDANNELWLLGRKNAIIKTESGILHPFSIEVAMREKTGKMAALVQHRGEVLLLSEAKESDATFEGVDRVLYKSIIPLDRRHNAKVDYNRLKKLLIK